MAKKLKLYNGRGEKKNEHLYIAAYSRADAARMLVEVYGRGINYWQREIKIYFSECWGNLMDGVEPKRGVWSDPNQNKFDDEKKAILIYDGENE